MYLLHQENVSTLQHQSVWAPTVCQLRRHGGYGSCRQLQIQGEFTVCLFVRHNISAALFLPFHSSSHFCFACRRLKTNRLWNVKRSSLQPDSGLPTLGRPRLHIKAFHCFLFVHSRLEAQSISIPPYLQSVQEGSSQPSIQSMAPTSAAVAHLVTHLAFSTQLKTMKYIIKGKYWRRALAECLVVGKL